MASLVLPFAQPRGVNPAGLALLTQSIAPAAISKVDGTIATAGLRT